MLSFSTMLPTRYNDGREIPSEVITALLALVDRVFGGYTLDHPSEGSCQGQIEVVRRLTVATYADRLPEARAIVKRIGQQLGQRSIYFAVCHDNVELL